MASQDKLLKLQQYERTKQLINDINFQKATELPMAAGAEGVSAPVKTRESSSFLLRRALDSVNRNDMSLVRDHLKVLSEIDPANVYYSNLLTRLNHGEHITWKEFEDAMSRFSYNQQYLIKLQDEINNAKLATEIEEEPVSEETVEEPVQVIAVPEEKPPSEEIHQPEQTQDQEPSHPEWRRRETPRPPLRFVRREPQREKTPEQARGIKQKMEKSESLPQEQVKRNAMPERRATAIGNDKIRKVPQQALEDRQKKRTAAAFLRGRAGSGFGIPWVPKFLQRWLGQLGRGALNGLSRLASGLGRAAVNTIARGLGQAAAQILPRLGVQAGLAAGRGLLVTTGTFLIGGGGALLIGILTVILGAFGLYLLQQKEVEDCGKSGIVNVIKSADRETVESGGIVKFELVITYRLNCSTATIDNVEVRDTLVDGAKYIRGSTTGTGVELVGPLGGFDPLDDTSPDIPNPIDVTLPRDNPNDISNSGIQPTEEGNTLIWKLGTLSPNIPVILTFQVQAPAGDLWFPNQAIVSYKEVSKSLGNSGGGYPPTQDNCNGKWPLKNPIGNFGDPKCDFTPDALMTQLKQLDPGEAAYWFNVVVEKETGGTYDPNSYNPKSSSGRGAYGLFQMNPDEGKDTYDIGNVDWQRQTSNAINYNNVLSRTGITWCYWEAAKPRWAPECRR